MSQVTYILFRNIVGVWFFETRVEGHSIEGISPTWAKLIRISWSENLLRGINGRIASKSLPCHLRAAKNRPSPIYWPDVACLTDCPLHHPFTVLVCVLFSRANLIVFGYLMFFPCFFSLGSSSSVVSTLVSEMTYDVLMGTLCPLSRSLTRSLTHSLFKQLTTHFITQHFTEGNATQHRSLGFRNTDQSVSRIRIMMQISPTVNKSSTSLNGLVTYDYGSTATAVRMRFNISCRPTARHSRAVAAAADDSLFVRHFNKTELLYVRNATTSSRSHKITSLATITPLLCLKIVLNWNKSWIVSNRCRIVYSFNQKPPREPSTQKTSSASVHKCLSRPARQTLNSA